MIFGKVIEWNPTWDGNKAVIDFADFPENAANGVRTFSFDLSVDVKERYDWAIVNVYKKFQEKENKPVYAAFEFEFIDEKPVITEFVRAFMTLESLQDFRRKTFHLNEETA